MVRKIQSALNQQEKAVNGSRIHVMGVAYKRDIHDMRESPALDVIHLLQELGANVTYTDPWIPKIDLDPVYMEGIAEAKGVQEADCVVIITDHKKFDYSTFGEECQVHRRYTASSIHAMP
ncbi:MAG: UDP binding domain-containing protein [Acidobacteriota bacterium]